MNDSIDKTTRKPLTPNAAFAKMLFALLAGTILPAVLLFGAAGRLDWFLGWLFVAVWALLKLVFIILLRWRDPNLLVKRTTRHENTQRYDHVIIPIYFVMAYGTIVLAGMDGGRFRWSGDLPLIVIILAYIIYLLGNSLASWAVSANAFFSSESRLQTDRNQTVTSNGPYRYVRHPAYLAAILLLWPVTGPMLESWWAIIPGLLAALMMIIRTVYEDRMLQKELQGIGSMPSLFGIACFPKPGNFKASNVYKDPTAWWVFLNHQVNHQT